MRKHLPAFLNGILAATFAASLATVAFQGDGIVDSTIGHRPQPPAATWHPGYAQMFPGCAKTLPADVIPSHVIEVRDGYPARVDFTDAWNRTHDADDTNNGDVVGRCA